METSRTGDVFLPTSSTRRSGRPYPSHSSGITPPAQTDIAVLCLSLVRLAPEATPLEIILHAGLAYGQEMILLGLPSSAGNSGKPREDKPYDFPPQPLAFVKARNCRARFERISKEMGAFTHIHRRTWKQFLREFSGGPRYRRSRTAGSAQRTNSRAPRSPALSLWDAPTRLKTLYVEATRGHEPRRGGQAPPVAFFAENQGFVVAMDIRHATEIIQKGCKTAHADSICLRLFEAQLMATGRTHAVVARRS